MLTFAPRTTLSAMLVTDAGAITGEVSRRDFCQLVSPQRRVGEAEEASAAKRPRLNGMSEGSKGNVPKLFQQKTESGKAFISARPYWINTKITMFPHLPHDILYSHFFVFVFVLSNRQEVSSDLRSKPGEF